MKEFYKLNFSYTTTGYIIKKQYISILLENFETSLKKLEKQYFEKSSDISNKYYLDIYWNNLKIKDNWYVYNKSFISQLHDYSDTETKETNYDKLFSTYYLTIMNNKIKLDATK